jgi:hypothetical protein
LFRYLIEGRIGQQQQQMQQMQQLAKEATLIDQIKSLVA